jgi:propanol-preferring alcohol dehydrogenase
MLAMRTHGAGLELVADELPMPEPGPGQVRIAVSVCGVCRTDLHVVDAELPDLHWPIVPGHEIVGRIEAIGPPLGGDAVLAEAEPLRLGDRVGVPWLGWTCGRCEACRSGHENLCSEAKFTGYQLDGGYAERAIADARYCFRIPDAYDDEQAAPLLCAGLIGHRALRMAGDARRVGFYGFGAAAHLIAQVAVWEGRRVFAFTREGDRAAQDFAREVGAVWAGDSTEPPPETLDAAILFAPVGALVPIALRAVRPGGTVVCAGIHMSDIPSFPYRDLWMERTIRSVANLTRRDAIEFLALAPQVPVRCHTEAFALRDANEALARLRDGRLTGAAVLHV